LPLEGRPAAGPVVALVTGLPARRRRSSGEP